jgi:CheY-like chemotaxis protein
MKILAVEDEGEYLEMLQMVMGSIGHSIVVARNGIEAIRILEKEKIDVILSDVEGSAMDGIELHKKIRSERKYQDTPFIFLAGLSDVKQVKKECTTSRDMLLQKPVSLERLLSMFAGRVRPVSR